ncbi:MAG TPA: hypothetical protein VEY08_14810 [Chloroflexia bacterium]|nr:hypothetical protein [Chloroflexia bacterium]
MTPNIELDIEELVLHGFAAADQHLIGAAVKSELARLFAERGVPTLLARGGEAPHLDAGLFQVAPSATPTAIGAQVAQAVYGGLAK